MVNKQPVCWAPALSSSFMFLVTTEGRCVSWCALCWWPCTKTPSEWLPWGSLPIGRGAMLPYQLGPSPGPFANAPRGGNAIGSSHRNARCHMRIPLLGVLEFSSEGAFDVIHASACCSSSACGHPPVHQWCTIPRNHRHSYNHVIYHNPHFVLHLFNKS